MWSNFVVRYDACYMLNTMINIGIRAFSTSEDYSEMNKWRWFDKWTWKSFHINYYPCYRYCVCRLCSRRSIHTYIHCVLTPVTGISLWTCRVGFYVFFLADGVFLGGGVIIFILFCFSFFLWGLVTLPHVSRFIVTCIFSAALLRVSVFSLKISCLVVLGVSLFSHFCSTWSWVSSSWWHILHALSGYLFL